jgi:hypothetical protein
VIDVGRLGTNVSRPVIDVEVVPLSYDVIDTGWSDVAYRLL